MGSLPVCVPVVALTGLRKHIEDVRLQLHKCNYSVVKVVKTVF